MNLNEESTDLAIREHFTALPIAVDERYYLIIYKECGIGLQPLTGTISHQDGSKDGSSIHLLHLANQLSESNELGRCETVGAGNPH